MPNYFGKILLKPHLGMLLTASVVSIVSAGAALAQPMFMQLLLEDMNNSDAEAVSGSLALLLTATLVEAAAVGTQTYLLYRVGANVVARVRRTLVSRILRWPLPRYSIFGRGTLTTVSTADSGAMHTLIAGGVFEIFTACILTVGSMIFMWLISPVLTMLTLGIVLVAVVVVVLASNSVRNDSRQAQEHTSSMADQLNATLGAIRTFRAAGTVTEREQRIDSEVEQSRQATERIGRRLSWVDPVSSLVVQGAFVSVLGFGGMMSYSGEISLAQLMAFLMYLMMTLMPIESGLGALPAVQRSLGSWDRIRTLLFGTFGAGEKRQDSAGEQNSSTTVVKASQLAGFDENFSGEATVPDEIKTPGGPMARTLRPPRITLRGIGHTLGSNRLFEDVEATFPAGSITALWGPSGTGKSTMMDILAGLVDPGSGEVLVDGTHRELALPCSYLEQRAPIIRGTLRENMLLGLPTANDEQLHAVLDRVGLTHLARRNEIGLDAPVGEDGLELSGGEGQRLALARLLLKPQPLVLLDEPTSRVDIATENLIHQAIKQLRGKHTIVIATHREATRELCDQVIEFRRRTADQRQAPATEPASSIGS